jgi:glycogen debranching enzyme
VVCVLTILDGSTFVISDDIGDVAVGAEGVFADDTRMLSRCRLLLDGESPLLLTSRAVDYFSATHYLRNAPSPRIPADTLSVGRERFVGSSVTEHLTLSNESMSELSFNVDLELAADFADIISVKAHDFAFGDPESAPPLPVDRVCASIDGGTFALEDDEGYRTTIRFSQPPELTPGGARFAVTLPAHARWELTFDVSFGSGLATEPLSRDRTFGTELQHVRESLGVWKLRVPRLETPALDLQRTYERSIADLASLRLKGTEGLGELPAAGMPWFMTVFGRDTLITSLQTLVFGPELAIGALRSLAALQAVEDDPSIDAEPGKILHELRRGKAATSWFPIYYGSIDATPLFLVLLSEVWRWTGDPAIVRELEPAARAALTWIDEYGDRDGDGFVEYERRAPHGLANQSWKDSGDSQRFRDGRLASTPIAPAEVQGYAYDARLRAAELADRVWDDPDLAIRLRANAAALRERFDEAFWVEERETYALALDGDKQPVDSLCSNLGHLLWSGIVPANRVGNVAAALAGPELWTGWGVRTMGAAEAAYNPLSYHNGTVWPHDTALAAWGLDRAGYTDLAQLFSLSLIEAAASLDYSLPEVFAGYERVKTAFPVAYPTAARPQAWAAGAPVLCLTLLLGLRPDPAAGTLVTSTTRAPNWLEGTRLEGIRAVGRVWSAEVRNGTIVVDET